MAMTWRPSLAVLLAALVSLAGCPARGDRTDQAVEKEQPVLRLPDQRTAVAAVIRARLAPDSRSAPDRDDLIRLYQPGEFNPIWLVAPGKPGPQADSALALLRRAPADGLDPAVYGLTMIEERVARLSADTGATPERLADLDIGLSTGMLRFLTHLHRGRVQPERLGFRLLQPPDRHDAPGLLLEALSRPALGLLVEALRPPLPWYHQLQLALGAYRAMAPDGPADLLPSVNASVHPGEAYPALDRLQRRLIKLGDLDPPDAGQQPGTVYHGALVQAVTRFQVRHGLDPDGVVGRKTLAELNQPVSRRIAQLELSLERLRWIPDPGPGPLILVNVPTFQLRAWDSLTATGSPALALDVIVGQAAENQTPVFGAAIQYLVFRPYWNVPAKIARKEIIPAQQRNPAYLARNEMEVVRGESDETAVVLPPTPENLASAAAGRLRIRQRPGRLNALGGVKFIFPNEAHVYLHDTPSQTLFSRARRDFSHGCIRVEHAARLAEWVLRQSPEWDAARIAEAMAAGPPRRVPLPHPVQVLIYYSTASVTEDGTVQFAADIYRHDARLAAALREAAASGSR